MKIIDINGSERNAEKVYPDPDYPGYMRIQFKRYHEWYTIDEFVKANPELKDLAKGAAKVAADVVGVVTKAGPDWLQDSSQTWKKDTYLGMFLWISRGKGEGQKRTVVKNAKNKIFIDKPWDTKPNTSSQYVISYNVHDVPAMGNTLPTEDMKALERKAYELDRIAGRLTKEKLSNDFKYLSQEELKNTK